MSRHSRTAVTPHRLAAVAILTLCAIPAAAIAQSATDLGSTVARMARVGRAGSPTFSPDGQRIAFISDLTGVPQIWVVPVDGGWPTLVTADSDPVGSVTWSPAGDWLAYTLAPGGGMNTQVYIVKPDGSGQKRLTPGGKETNRLFGWTPDGLRLALGANTRNPTAIDAYLADPLSGERHVVVQNAAMATLEDVSRDGRTGLVSRLVGRRDNNLYLVDFATRRETLLTPHTGPGTFSGELAPDGQTVYLVSNKDRDLLQLDEALRDELPVVFDFLGVADPDRPSPRIEPEVRQRRLLEVQRRLVREEREPEVWLIEDLHWLDEASEAFVADWASAVQDTRALLLVNYRPQYRAPWLRKAHELPLAALGAVGMRELLTALLGTDASLAELTALIEARVGGNPFFAEEFVRSLAESGRLVGTTGAYP